MKTVKLKIKHFECLEELKLFNSILRYAYNRFQEGLKQKEARADVSNKFKGNSWFVQCAIKEGKAVFEKFKGRKVVFGGKHNLKQYMKGLISKEEYRLNRLSPITIQGEACKGGNRLFNFDFYNSKLELKLFRNDHRIIEIPMLRNNYRKEFAEIQRLTDEKKLTLTVKFNQDYIWFTYDESQLQLDTYKGLKKDRILGIDLNPNYIGLSILEFNPSNEFKVLYKQVFDLRDLNRTSRKSSSDKASKYLTNKRQFELIEICHEISGLLNYWKCSKLCIEDLNIKSSNKGQGKYFNRLCNNVWDRNLVVNKLKLLSVIHGFELTQVNPVYSSFIGNMLYGSQNCPDMIAASVEIARRGYRKFEKGWFYPAFGVESIDERWKQTLTGVESWKSAFEKVKKSGLKYRFQLADYIGNAVFSKKYIRKHINKLVYM